MPVHTYLSAADIMRKVQLSRAAQLDLANAALKRRAAASAAGGVPLAVAAGGSVPSLPIQLPAVVARRAPPKALKSSGFNSFWGEGKRGWRAELVSPKLRVAVTAELFGTFLFVATGLLSVMSTSQVMGGTGAAALDLVSDAAASTFSAPLAAPYTGAAEVTVVGPDVGPGTDILWVGAGVTQIIARQMAISLVFGFMICVLVFATGAISGGNINPAVTLSLFLQGKMSVLRMVLYVLAQCGGAIMGAFYARSLSPYIFVSVEGGRNDLSDRVKIDWGGNLWSTLGAEICGTALLVFTVSAAADAGREQAFKCVCTPWSGARAPSFVSYPPPPPPAQPPPPRPPLLLQVRGRPHTLDDRLCGPCDTRCVDSH
jgi:glycerol uptake facilitator-like aquaporin